MKISLKISKAQNGITVTKSTMSGEEIYVYESNGAKTVRTFAESINQAIDAELSQLKPGQVSTITMEFETVEVK